MVGIPTRKIKGRHKLDSVMRDIHAGYGKHILIKENMSLGQLEQESNVEIPYKKFMGKREGYYRYYYYKAYPRMKKSARIAVGHPVIIQRKHKRNTFL